MKLMALLAEGVIPIEQVVEIIKRLPIVNYEQARSLIDAAINQGEVEPNTLPGYYWQSQLFAVIEWNKQKE